MSEYVRKQALVQEISGKIDWLIGRSEDYRSCGHENKACEFSKVISEFASLRGRIQSGAFDADESEGTWKATAEVLGRENAQLDSEIQRLRAALESLPDKIMQISRFADTEELTFPLENPTAEEQSEWLDEFLDRLDMHVRNIVDNEIEALSTTSEPTNAAKVKRIECPCCGCEISINAPEGDGNDV
jgi:hypothetical protein